MRVAVSRLEALALYFRRRRPGGAPGPPACRSSRGKKRAATVAAALLSLGAYRSLAVLALPGSAFGIFGSVLASFLAGLRDALRVVFGVAGRILAVFVATVAAGIALGVVSVLHHVSPFSGFSAASKRRRRD